MRGHGSSALAVSVLALLGLLLTAGCATGAAGPYRTSTDGCYAFGVHAIERHIMVTAMPRACSGLSQAQVNAAIAKAIRAAAGPGPKAVVRRRALQDSVYLAHLYRVIAPPRQVPTAAGPAGQAAGQPSGLVLRLAALAVWILTAAAGGYLLAGFLGGAGRRRLLDRVPATIAVHAGLAITGLGVWIGFVASGVPALAWVAVVIINMIAALGMAVLVGAPPQAQAGGRRAPVIVIALHGMLAIAALLLVLTAALSAT